MRRSILVGAVLAAVVAAGTLEVITNRSSNASPASVAEGARLYQVGCLSCHGPDGNGRALAPVPGVRAPALNRLDPAVYTPSRLAHVIRVGSPPMPAFQSVLSPAEIRDLASYVRTLITPRTKAGSHPASSHIPP